MKKAFLVVSTAAMLFVLSTASISVSAEGNVARMLTESQESNLSSYFEQRGDLLKRNSNSNLLSNELAVETLNNKDEAVGLVQLMEDVHDKSLVDYQVKYSVNEVEVSEAGQIATAELYQIFTWSDSEVKTEFKDEVKINISPKGEVQIDFPQMEVNADILVANANELNSKMKLEKAAPLTEEDTSLSLMAASYTYNRTAVRNYIDTYWDNYNPAYVAYGNDCTNFASQAIRAGGIPVFIQANGSDANPSWYYNLNANGWLRSLSWINVDELFDLLRNYNTIDAVASSHSGMAIGDIIQYDKGSDGDKDHTAIVSFTETPAWDPSQKFVYVSYHTTDRHNVSWDFYANAYANTSTYFTHINNTQY